MKIEKQIKYELTIDRKDGHHIGYEQNLENDIAGLMIATLVLQTNVDYLKEAKQSASGPERKAISKQIAFMSRTLSGNKQLVMQLCDSYETYKLAADVARKKQEAQSATP